MYTLKIFFISLIISFRTYSADSAVIEYARVQFQDNKGYTFLVSGGLPELCKQKKGLWYDPDSANILSRLNCENMPIVPMDVLQFSLDFFLNERNQGVLPFERQIRLKKIEPYLETVLTMIDHFALPLNNDLEEKPSLDQIQASPDFLKSKLIYYMHLSTRYCKFGTVARCCKKSNFVLSCADLAQNQNSISWDQNTYLKFASRYKPCQVIFQYTNLEVNSKEYCNRLILRSSEYFDLAGIDLSGLKPCTYIADEEAENGGFFINNQKIIFDFSDNNIREISWSDLYAMYAYIVALAQYYNTVFRQNSSVFLFNNNQLLLMTKIKLCLLQTILRLRLLLYGLSFVKYRYISW